MAVAMVAQAAMACSICGSAATGAYPGVLPLYQKHFVGLRYSYRSFNTIHPPSIIPGMSGSKSSEVFQSVELMGRYVPVKRLQIFGFLAFQQLQQKTASGRSFQSGLGDATILAYYSILPARENKNKVWKHLLQMGAGVKLPTGRNTSISNEQEYNASFQLGTGSTDALFSIIYSAKAKHFGFLNDATLSVNGKNRYGYKFGNKLSGTTRIFYTVNRCKGLWMFQTGIYGEYANADANNSAREYYTGSSLIMPMAGVDFYAKKWALGFNYRVPAWQNISSGYVKSNARLVATVSAMF